jgi:hypothetical protein
MVFTSAASAQERQEAQPQARIPAIARALGNPDARLGGLQVPLASEFVAGDRVIAAKTTQKGPVAVIGTLRVSGTIDGDAFSYGGDIIVLPGGHITGNAVAITGSVQADDDAIDGESRSIGGVLTQVVPRTAVANTKDTVALTLGWAGVMLLIGLGVLVFGGRTLDVVGETVDQQFGRSFLVGIGATLGLVPALALLLIGLTLTILGILLVPFAIVAYLLAAIGIVTLGFLAAMCVTGHSLRRNGGRLTDRGAALRALIIGETFFLGLWLVAALATPWPAFASVMRVIAFALTWAAATVGLGATIISRAGTRTVRRGAQDTLAVTGVPFEHEAVAVAPVAEWLTPTPVSGVVAARRRPSAQHKTS